jgi:hypothetical protein
MKKISQSILNLGTPNTPTTPPASITPAKSNSTLNLGTPTATEKVVDLGEIDKPTTKSQKSNSIKYHPHLKEVEQMQDKMRTFSNNIKINIPQFSPEKYSKDVKFDFDPNIFNQIQDISRKVSNEGKSVADGLWGPRTQQALNGLYNFAEAMVNVLHKDDPKYKDFLTRFAAIAHTGKKFTDIKNPKADAIEVIRLLDMMNDLLLELEQFLKEKLPQMIQQEKIVQQKQEQAKTQEQVQEKTQEQVKEKTQEKSQETKPTSSFDIRIFGNSLPFDLDNDVISFDRIKMFLYATSSYINLLREKSEASPEYRAALSTYISSLVSAISNVSNLLSSWNVVAGGTPGLNGGFTLTVNEDINSFTSTYANNDIKIARNMFNTLVPIFQALSNMMRTLGADPNLTSILGADIFTNQYQRGIDYVSRLRNFVSQINYNLGHQK